ncbi:hypothetical protein GCM10023063_21060 [Arthrobacter methylotrophus]
MGKLVEFEEMDTTAKAFAAKDLDFPAGTQPEGRIKRTSRERRHIQDPPGYITGAPEETDQTGTKRPDVRGRAARRRINVFHHR